MKLIFEVTVPGPKPSWRDCPTPDQLIGQTAARIQQAFDSINLHYMPHPGFAALLTRQEGEELVQLARTLDVSVSISSRCIGVSFE